MSVSEKIPIPYPHTRRQGPNHNVRTCTACQTFIANGGPALQSLARTARALQRASR